MFFIRIPVSAPKRRQDRRKQLTDIINNHENRKQAIAEALYSKENTKTLAILFLDTDKFEKAIEEILTNFKTKKGKS